MPSLPLPEDLRDGDVALRRLRARDAAPFAAAFRDDPGLGPAIGVEEDPGESQARRLIARQARERARAEFLGLAVTDATGRPFLGTVMLHTFAWAHGRAEVGYWLVAAARGRGIGRRATGLLVEHAFGTLRLRRLEITTTPDNAAALGVAAALGFAREGTMRARNVERGVPIDVVVLGRLSPRWAGADGSGLVPAEPVA